MPTNDTDRAALAVILRYRYGDALPGRDWTDEARMIADLLDMPKAPAEAPSTGGGEGRE